MTKKLTLEDRYFLNMYSRRLPCTIALRFSFDKFLDQIEITSDEVKKYDVKINSESLKFECNDKEFIVEYEEFPPAVIEAMKKYISMFDHDKNKNNEMLKRTFEYYRKIM
jgi:hypothetical protein